MDLKCGTFPGLETKKQNVQKSLISNQNIKNKMRLGKPGRERDSRQIPGSQGPRIYLK